MDVDAVASSSSSAAVAAAAAVTASASQVPLSSSIPARRVLKRVFPTGQFEGFVFDKTPPEEADVQRRKSIADRHKNVRAYLTVYQDPAFVPVKDITVGAKTVDGVVVDAVWATRVCAPLAHDLASIPTSTALQLSYVKKELDEMGSVEKAELTPASRICVDLEPGFAGFMLGSDMCKAFKEPRKQRRKRSAGSAELAEDGESDGARVVKTRAATVAAKADAPEKKAGALPPQRVRKNGTTSDGDGDVLEDDAGASIEAIKAQFAPAALLPKDAKQMTMTEFCMHMTRKYASAGKNATSDTIKKAIDDLVPATKKSADEWQDCFASDAKVDFDTMLGVAIKTCVDTSALYAAKADEVLADAARLIKKNKAADLARIDTLSSSLCAFERNFQIQKVAYEEALAAAAAAAAAAQKGPKLLAQILALRTGANE